MRRSLVYYWRINLAVALGAAVATAVLTGALLVGDSVRGSLRDLTLDRLGKIDYALVTHRYFREEMLVELALRPEIEAEFEAMASAIITSASALHAETKARASGVNLYAVDDQFFSFYESNSESGDLPRESLKKSSGQVFPSILISQSLQKELRAELGDQILLSFEKPSDIARSSVLGRKDTEDVVETMRLTLTQIVPDRGFGRFTLQPNQSLPLNAFVSLPVLQKALDKKDQVNAILVSQKADAEMADRTVLLQSSLQEVLDSEDLGLQFHHLDSTFSIESDESILSPHLVDLAKSVGEELQTPMLSSYVYLANKIEANGRLLPYSTVAALNTDVGSSFPSLKGMDGGHAPRLSSNEILFNEWAAADLGVRAGQEVKMTYFGVGPRDELFTKETSFFVKGMVRMTGLAADKELTPDYPGIADADNMADWDPPFPVDLSLIRPKDEAYWD
ncbi:hypothetical protein MJD09_23590, partial [bacterium]|nr:hypothetical protein [bacterium]